MATQLQMFVWSVGLSKKNEEEVEEKEQGRIHGYPSRVRVGRSSAGEGH